MLSDRGGKEQMISYFTISIFLAAMIASLLLSILVIIHLLKRCTEPIELRFWVGLTIGITVGATGLATILVIAI